MTFYVLGLRPGYVYRLQLTNLPYHPDRALYPEIEVRGVLVPRPGMKYMDFPIPLTFPLSDIERALNGALARARISARATLATVTVELPGGSDPSAIVCASRRPGEPWFLFEQPDRGRRALACLGEATALRASGPDRFKELAGRWRKLAGRTSGRKGATRGRAQIH